MYSKDFRMQGCARRRMHTVLPHERHAANTSGWRAPEKSLRVQACANTLYSELQSSLGMWTQALRDLNVSPNVVFLLIQHTLPFNYCLHLLAFVASELNDSNKLHIPSLRQSTFLAAAVAPIHICVSWCGLKLCSMFPEEACTQSIYCKLHTKLP